jgi:hypothetical protein
MREQGPREHAVMASHPTREVEAQLSGLLDQVVDWLQFAESKNTGGSR